MAISVRLLELPEDRKAKSYRFTPATDKRLKRLRLRLGQTETAVLELAVIHLLGTLERDHAVWLTSLEEPQVAPDEEQA